jgi:MFS family permease
LMKNANLRNALLISGLVLYSKDLFVAYFPIYGTQLGMNAAKIGLFLSLMAVMQIVVRVMQFHLVKWFGRTTILLVSLGTSGIVFVMVPFSSLSVILAGLAMVLGAGLGLGQPLSIVYAMNSSPPGRIGEVLGIRLGINRASQFGAPIILGAIGAIAGLSSIFWLGGTVLIIGAIATRTKNPKKEV